MSQTHSAARASSHAPQAVSQAPDGDAQDLMGNGALCELDPAVAAEIAAVAGSVTGLLALLPPMTASGEKAGASISTADAAGLATHGASASGAAGKVEDGIDAGDTTLARIECEVDDVTSNPAWAAADADLDDLWGELDAAGVATLGHMTLGAPADGGDDGDGVVSASIDARVAQLRPTVVAAAALKELVAEVGSATGADAVAAAARIQDTLTTHTGEARTYVERFVAGVGADVRAALDGKPVALDEDASKLPAGLDKAAEGAGASGPKAPGKVDTGNDVSIPREARVGAGESSDPQWGASGYDRTDKSWSEDGSGSTSKTSAKLDASSDGTLSAKGARDDASWNADGSGEQKNRSAEAKIDKNGKITVGASSKTETVDADGNKSVKSASLGIDSDGKAKASVGRGGHTEAGVEWGAKGEGSADFKVNEDGTLGLDGASGSGTVQFGPVRVQAGVGFQDKFGIPSPQGDGWAAPWSRSFTANVGGGGGGSKASGGMSAQHSRDVSGVAMFPTAEAAKQFKDAGELPAWVPAVPDTFAPAIDDLKDGESITMSTGTDFGVDGKGSASAVSVNGGVSTGAGSQVQVEKKDGRLEVTVMTLQRDGANAGVGAGGVGMKGNLGRGSASHTTVSFDLSTPEGRASYEAWAKNPDARPAAGPGADKVSEGKGSMSTSGKGIDVGPGTAGGVSQEGVYDEELADGRKARTHHGSHQTSAQVKLPLVGTLEDDKRKYGISARTVEDRDGSSETTWNLKSEVNAGTARGNSDGLADAEGDHHKKDVLLDGKGSGQWTVEEELSDDSMKAFADKVKSGTYVPGIGTHAQGATEELQARLKAAAGDPDKEREAIASYVATGGEDSIRGIKSCPGVEEGKRHYALKGDKYLTGREGHARFQGTLKKLRDRLADPDADLGSIAADARALLAETAAKSSQLQNPANYPDLPNGARMEIIAEVREQMTEVMGLLSATDSTRRHSGDIPITTDSAVIDARYRKMGAGRHICEVKMHRAEIERRMLKGYGIERAGSARSHFSAGSFEDADSAWADAQTYYGNAQTAEAAALAIDPYAADGAAHGSAIRAIDAAALAFEQAAIGFENARAKYTALRKRAGEESPGIVRPDKAQPLSWLPVADPTLR